MPLLFLLTLVAAALAPTAQAFKCDLVFQGFKSSLDSARNHNTHLAEVSRKSDRALKNQNRLFSATMLRLLRRPPSVENARLNAKAKEDGKWLARSKELLGLLESADQEVTRLRNSDTMSKEFPRQLKNALDALNAIPQDSGFYGLPAELKELGPQLNGLIDSLAKSGIGGKESPYDSADVDALLSSAERLSLSHHETSLRLTGAVKEAIEARRQAEAALRVGDVLGNAYVVEEWKDVLEDPKGANIPVDTARMALSSRVDEKKRLVNGKIEAGDLFSYMAGQIAMSEILRGKSPSAEQANFARAFLRAQAASKSSSPLPQHFPPEQRTFLNAIRQTLDRTAPERRRFLDGWLKFLNQQEKPKLTAKEIAAITALVDNTDPNPAITTRDWHRLNYLTNGKTTLTDDERDFLFSLTEKIHGRLEYASLEWHLVGLLERGGQQDQPWKDSSAGQRDIALNTLRRRYRRGDPLKVQDLPRPSRVAQMQKLASLGTGRVLSESRSPYQADPDLSAAENSRLEALDEFYKARLLGIALQGREEVSSQEKTRAQAAFQRVNDLKKKVALPANAADIRANLDQLLANYGGRPLNPELFEDVLRYQLSQHPGEIKPNTLRLLPDPFLDPSASQIDSIESDDGWTTSRGDRSIKLNDWLDEGMFNPKEGANKFGWERVGELSPGQSKNPSLKDHKREFFWGTSAYNHTTPGDMRMSLQTDPGGGRSLEGFVNLTPDAREDTWIAFSADEVTNEQGQRVWERRDRVARRNSKGEKIGEESLLKACARCHMNAMGRLTPKPIGIAIPGFLHP
ncbi:MAG: hypothetical protein HYR96_06485 [Deltaproteobacteria bacterium]|nr:hypothetical protein [Deltaproteobacteria bacterium]